MPTVLEKSKRRKVEKPKSGNGSPTAAETRGYDDDPVGTLRRLCAEQGRAADSPSHSSHPSSLLLPPSSLPYVNVLWHDIVVDNAWSPAAGELPPSRCVTRGWLVRDIPSEHYIVVASGLSLNDNGEWDANPRTAIPRSLVTMVPEPHTSESGTRNSELGTRNS